MDLKERLEDAESKANNEEITEEHKAKLSELEKEVEALTEQKEKALLSFNEAESQYAETIAESKVQINTLNKDLDVHREQMELAQTMLEEKETLASELKNQLLDVTNADEMRMAQLEEDLAAKGREVGNVTAELVERTKDVAMLEERLEKARKELLEHRAEAQAALAAATAVAAAATTAKDEALLAGNAPEMALQQRTSSFEEQEAPKEEEVDNSVGSKESATAESTAHAAHLKQITELTEEKAAHTAQITEQMATLTEKETQIERLERELGTSKRLLEATRFELNEKDKQADRLKSEFERLKSEKCTRVTELEHQLEEKNKTIEILRKDLNSETESLEVVVGKMEKLHSDLDTAMNATRSAEDAYAEAISEMKSSKAAKETVLHESLKLRSEINLLEKTNEAAMTEVDALKEESEKNRKSNMQAAAALATTNAARQAEMEMTIEKMQKEIEFRKREIDASKFMSLEGDEAEGLVFTFTDTCWLALSLSYSSLSSQIGAQG